MSDNLLEPNSTSGSQVTPGKPPSSATASLVLGVLSITCLWLLGSIPAIILGAMALKRIGISPEPLSGKGKAVAGIVTGSVGIVAGLIPLGMVASVALPAFSSVQSRAQETIEINQMKQINFACKIYAIENGNQFPERLADLVPDYLPNESLISWEDPETRRLVPVIYRSGLNEQSPPDEILALAPFPRNGKRAVVFVNGVTQLIDEAI
ncbi:MAG: DUF4190 domain-containing protein, partial [Verrucomicrobiota bacterium]